MNYSTRAISRTIVVVVVVVILIVAGLGIYFVTLPPSSSTTTSTTSSSSTITTTSSSSILTTTSSQSTTTSSSSQSQDLTVELQTAPGAGINLYQLTTNTWPFNLVYDPIFNYNLTTQSSIPIPWLATGYTVDSTGQNWTITLRQGIHYSDGTSFNATSVKMAIDDFILSHVETSTYDSFIHGAVAYISSNENAANQTAFINNDGMKAVSTYVLQINLAKPEADLLSYLAGTLQIYFDVSPSAIIANGGITPGVGNNWLTNHGAGTGPYLLDSYDPATNAYAFSANPNWWGITVLGMHQPFKTIHINVVTNLATQELDLRTGKSDLMFLPATNLYDFANRTTWTTQNKLTSAVSGVNVYGPYLDTKYSLLEFNQAIRTSSGALASVQPFQNFNLRKAIVEAWNETAFIQQDLNGLGASNPGVMLQGMLGYQSYPAYYPYNLTQSMKDIQAACAQLGCSKSNPLQITFIATNDEISELAGSLLVSTINSMQAGITLNFQPLAISAKISTFLAATFGISLYVQPNEPPDPLTMLYQFGSTFGTQGGRLGFNVTSITNMLNQAAATSDITARSALYVQIDQAIAQTASWPEVFQEQAVYATSSRIHIEPFNTVLLNVLPPVFAMSAM